MLVDARRLLNLLLRLFCLFVSDWILTLIMLSCHCGSVAFNLFFLDRRVAFNSSRFRLQDETISSSPFYPLYRILELAHDGRDSQLTPRNYAIAMFFCTFLSC